MAVRGVFALAGANHFINTAFYVGIMPPYLPRPAALVYASGAAEMMPGVALLFSRMERLAAWGMILLMVAVTPVHVHRAFHPERYPDCSGAVLWLRLLLQGALPGLVFWFTRPRRPSSRPLARKKSPGRFQRIFSRKNPVSMTGITPGRGR